MKILDQIFFFIVAKKNSIHSTSRLVGRRKRKRRDGILQSSCTRRATIFISTLKSYEKISETTSSSRMERVEPIQ